MKRRLAVAVILALTVLTSLPAVAAAPIPPGHRPNVLFISIDDLRPELGCYGVARAKTPNIDRLASTGTLFLRAYCQQALCAPSQASLMTGLRPHSAGVTNLVTHIRRKNPRVVTLSQQFRNSGYHSVSFGKIYHPGLDDPASWSEPAWFTPGPEYVSTSTMEAVNRMRRERGADRYIPGSAPAIERDPETGLGLLYEHPKEIRMGPATEAPDVEDEETEDGKTAVMAVNAMRRLAKGDKPFFLAVGFNRPHLPFVAPKKYWDLYPPEEVELAPNPFPPKDVPPEAMHDVGEFASYQDLPSITSVTQEKKRELVRGYLACVSHVDALVGRLLDTLDELGLTDKTIVCLWGDHGYHLGEHTLWCKHTTFEVATRVPLIIRAPGQKHPGARTEALAELIDVYPTLCELVGIPVPDHVEGTSLVPVMEDPKTRVKDAAYFWYPVRNGRHGFSIRTDRYRYTEWRRANTRALVGVELYDHETDPLENVNIALRPENAELTATLSQKLAEGWKDVLGGSGGVPGIR